MKKIFSRFLSTGTFDTAFLRASPAEHDALERSLRRKVNTGFVVALVALAAIGFMSWRSTRRANEVTESVARTHEMLQVLEDVFSDVLDVEGGARGFAATGNSSMLEAYNVALNEIGPKLDRLRRLTLDSATQQTRLDELSTQIAAKIEFNKKVVASRADAGSQPRFELGEGKRLMDSARATYQAMRRDEERLLQARNVQASDAVVTSLLTTGAGTLVGVVFLLVAGIVINREIHTGARTRAEVRALNADLETRVAQRTAELTRVNAELQRANAETTRANSELTRVNSELSRVNRELQLEIAKRERIQEHLAIAMDAAQLGDWDLDLTTQQAYRSQRHDEIFGYDHQKPEWNYEVLLQHVHDNDRESVARAFSSAHTTGKLRVDCRIPWSDGTDHWIELIGRAYFNQDQRAIRMAGVVMDTTDREQAVLALKESERNYSDLFTHSPDAIFVEDKDGVVLNANPAACRLHGLVREELIGRNVCGLVAPEYREKLRREMQEWFVKPVTSFEGALLAADGRLVPVEIRAAPTRYSGQAALLMLARDISKRRKAEDSARALSGQLLQAQDEERRRIARELHDTTAQHLAALVLNLSFLKRHLPDDPPRIKTVFADSLELADRAAQEIRTLAYLLHPPLLEAVGLVGAVKDYADGFGRRSGIALKVDAPDTVGRFSREAELALFRIVQESLGNVMRHSGSETATIRLARQPESVIVEVRDAGRGIPPEKLSTIQDATRALGVGIAGMRERVRQLGGKIEVESGPGGTTVRATLPANESVRNN